VGLFGPPDVDKLNRRGSIAGLVRAAKYKGDPEVREKARLSLEEHMDLLIDKLQTKSMTELGQARDGLVLIGAPARDKLIFILENGHLHRRQDAAFVLGIMKDPAAVEPLKLALLNPDPLLRMLCIQALAKIGDPRAVDSLRRGLSDVDPKVAEEARKALKKLGALS